MSSSSHTLKPAPSRSAGVPTHDYVHQHLHHEDHEEHSPELCGFSHSLEGFSVKDLDNSDARERHVQYHEEFYEPSCVFCVYMHLSSHHHSGDEYSDEYSAEGYYSDEFDDGFGNYDGADDDDDQGIADAENGLYLLNGRALENTDSVLPEEFGLGYFGDHATRYCDFEDDLHYYDDDGKTIDGNEIPHYSLNFFENQPRLTLFKLELKRQQRQVEYGLYHEEYSFQPEKGYKLQVGPFVKLYIDDIDVYDKVVLILQVFGLGKYLNGKCPKPLHQSFFSRVITGRFSYTLYAAPSEPHVNYLNPLVYWIASILQADVFSTVRALNTVKGKVLRLFEKLVSFEILPPKLSPSYKIPKAYVDHIPLDHEFLMRLQKFVNGDPAYFTALSVIFSIHKMAQALSTFVPLQTAGEKAPVPDTHRTDVIKHYEASLTGSRFSRSYKHDVPILHTLPDSALVSPTNETFALSQVKASVVTPKKPVYKDQHTETEYVPITAETITNYQKLYPSLSKLLELFKLVIERYRVLREDFANHITTFLDACTDYGNSAEDSGSLSGGELEEAAKSFAQLNKNAEDLASRTMEFLSIYAVDRVSVRMIASDIVNLAKLDESSKVVQQKFFSLMRQVPEFDEVTRKKEIKLLIQVALGINSEAADFLKPDTKVREEMVVDKGKKKVETTTCLEEPVNGISENENSIASGKTKILNTGQTKPQNSQKVQSAPKSQQKSASSATSSVTSDGNGSPSMKNKTISQEDGHVATSQPLTQKKTVPSKTGKAEASGKSVSNVTKKVSQPSQNSTDNAISSNSNRKSKSNDSAPKKTIKERNRLKETAKESLSKERTANQTSSIAQLKDPKPSATAPAIKGMSAKAANGQISKAQNKPIKADLKAQNPTKQTSGQKQSTVANMPQPKAITPPKTKEQTAFADQNAEIVNKLVKNVTQHTESLRTMFDFLPQSSDPDNFDKVFSGAHKSVNDLAKERQRKEIEEEKHIKETKLRERKEEEQIHAEIRAGKLKEQKMQEKEQELKRLEEEKKRQEELCLKRQAERKEREEEKRQEERKKREGERKRQEEARLKKLEEQKKRDEERKQSDEELRLKKLEGEKKREEELRVKKIEEEKKKEELRLKKLEEEKIRAKERQEKGRKELQALKEEKERRKLEKSKAASEGKMYGKAMKMKQHSTKQITDADVQNEIQRKTLLLRRKEDKLKAKEKAKQAYLESKSNPIIRIGTLEADELFTKSESSSRESSIEREIEKLEHNSKGLVDQKQNGEAEVEGKPKIVETSKEIPVEKLSRRQEKRPKKVAMRAEAAKLVTDSTRNTSIFSVEKADNKQDTPQSTASIPLQELAPIRHTQPVKPASFAPLGGSLNQSIPFASSNNITTDNASLFGSPHLEPSFNHLNATHPISSISANISPNTTSANPIGTPLFPPPDPAFSQTPPTTASFFTSNSFSNLILTNSIQEAPVDVISSAEAFSREQSPRQSLLSHLQLQLPQPQQRQSFAGGATNGPDIGRAFMPFVSPSPLSNVGPFSNNFMGNQQRPSFFGQFSLIGSTDNAAAPGSTNYVKSVDNIEEDLDFDKLNSEIANEVFNNDEHEDTLDLGAGSAVGGDIANPESLRSIVNDVIDSMTDNSPSEPNRGTTNYSSAAASKDSSPAPKDVLSAPKDVVPAFPTPVASNSGSSSTSTNGAPKKRILLKRPANAPPASDKTVIVTKAAQKSPAAKLASAKPSESQPGKGKARTISIETNGAHKENNSQRKSTIPKAEKAKNRARTAGDNLSLTSEAVEISLFATEESDDDGSNSNKKVSSLNEGVSGANQKVSAGDRFDGHNFDDYSSQHLIHTALSNNVDKVSAYVEYLRVSCAGENVSALQSNAAPLAKLSLNFNVFLSDREHGAATYDIYHDLQNLDPWVGHHANVEKLSSLMDISSDHSEAILNECNNVLSRAMIYMIFNHEKAAQIKLSQLKKGLFKIHSNSREFEQLQAFLDLNPDLFKIDMEFYAKALEYFGGVLVNVVGIAVVIIREHFAPLTWVDYWQPVSFTLNGMVSKVIDTLTFQPVSKKKKRVSKNDLKSNS